MSDIVFPDFVPNQILTDTQLNQLRNYLEQQELDARTRLVGRGIVCGLGVKVISTGSTRQLELTGGFGLSSDGDLIEACSAQSLTRFRAYDDPDKDDAARVRYEPWLHATNGIFELSADSSFGSLLTANELTDRVLVLYLEFKPIENDICLVTCDNKGRKVEVSVRPLLVHKLDLTVLATPPAPGAPYHLPRLHTKIDLRNVASATDIDNGYRGIVTAHATAVGNAAVTLFTQTVAGSTLAEFVGLRDISTFQPNQSLGIKLSAAPSAQYAYDALADIVAAYNEALAAAFALVKECCPASTFPRHLMLGLTSDLGNASYRNEFLPASTRNVLTGDRERVRGLFTRLRWLCDNVSFAQPPGSVTLVPSHDESHALGRRAVPFYFAGVGSLWQPLRAGSADGDGPWHEPLLGSSLADTYASATLVRLEGDVGGNADSITAAVLDARHKGNAEFDVLCACIDDPDAGAKAALGALAQALEAKTKTLEKEQQALDLELFTGQTAELDQLLAETPREKLESAIKDALKSWADARVARVLKCDLAALELEYLAARSEFICCLARTAGAVARLAAEVERLQVGGTFTQSIVDYDQAARSAFADALFDMLAEPDLVSDDEFNDIRRSVLEAIEKSPRMDALAPLTFELSLLRRYLVRIEAVDLPKDVRRFHYGRFKSHFQDIERMSIEIWLWCLLLELPLSGRPTGTRPSPPEPPPSPVDEGGVPTDETVFHPKPVPVAAPGASPLATEPGVAGAAFGRFDRARALELVTSLDWSIMAREQAEASSWICDEGVKNGLPLDPFAWLEREAVFGDLLATARCCSRAQLGAVAAALEQVFALDLTRFSRLAAQVDGLEHRAGVPKGGTLVLVRDQVNGSPQIRADFALEGKLPCCCPVPTELCLPPIVHADERVIVLEVNSKGSYSPVDFWIDVAPNDRNQNLFTDEGDPGFEVGLTSQSSLLAELCVSENKIHYRMDHPVPGVDRFSYTIAFGGECGGTVEIGHVLVALVAPSAGTVSGTVRRGTDPVPNVNVAMKNSADVVAYVTSTDDKGAYQIAGIAADTYTISALAPGEASEIETIPVTANAHLIVDLDLLKLVEFGTIVVTLKPSKQGVPVRLHATNGPAINFTAQTDANGSVTFTGVIANWIYYADAPSPQGSWISQSDKVKLRPNDTVSLIIDTSGPSPSVGVAGAAIAGVAAAQGISVREAALRAQELLANRSKALIDPLWDPTPEEAPAFNRASEFVQDSLSSEHSLGELMTSFKALVAQTQRKNDEASRAALTAAGLALLNRVAVTSPGALSTETEAVARTVGQAFKSTGIDANAALKSWNGAELGAGLAITSTPAIENVVRVG